MSFLLDVNVLIALIDRTHVNHDAAHEWFAGVGSANWATCPITENGVIRIVGRTSYPNSPGSPTAVAALLRKLSALPGHVFWPDMLSLLNASLVDISGLTSPRQVTDSYLLALAVSRSGQLATFDRRLSSKAVIGGEHALCVIG